MSKRPSFQTPLLSRPTVGNKAVPIDLDFTNVALIVTDVTEEIIDDALAMVQSVYVDNSANAHPLDITFVSITTAGFHVTIPANAQAFLPVSVPKGKVVFTATSGLGGIAHMELLNIPVAPMVWPSANIGNVTANVVPVVANLIDRSMAVTGGDDTPMGVNAARTRMILQNSSNNANPMWINFGAAASAANSIELAVGERFDSGFGPVSGQAVHVLGTVGDLLIAKES